MVNELILQELIDSFHDQSCLFSRSSFLSNCSSVTKYVCRFSGKFSGKFKRGVKSNYKEILRMQRSYHDAD